MHFNLATIIGWKWKYTHSPASVYGSHLNKLIAAIITSVTAMASYQKILQDFEVVILSINP